MYCLQLKDLQVGDKGQEVKILQLLLNSAGYNCGTCDGIFGQRTKSAVINANVKAINKQDPNVSRETWEYLFNK